MIDVLSELVNIRFAEIANPDIGVNAGSFEDGLSGLAADTVDVGKADLNSLVSGQVYAANTRHKVCLPP